MTATLIIFHDVCRDGFCAAWVLDKVVRGEKTFHPALYGEKPPMDLILGRDVIIADFCYPLEEMRAILASANSLTVFDHHKTAEPVLRALGPAGEVLGPELEIHFDNNRSGARMVWDHFSHPNQTIPWLVTYTEDRDLWRWKLPESKAVNAYISALPFHFARWDEAARNTVERVADSGYDILMKIEQYCDDVCKQARTIVFHGYNTPIVNAAYPDLSEVLNALLTKTGASISMGWFQRADGKYQYSLRSAGEVDVGELAKRYGGGGHHNAAGFETITKVLGRAI